MNTKCLQQTVMIVLLLLAGCTQGDEGAPSVRTIPIPKREHGYSNFDSTAIASQEALDRFLETGSKAEKMGWNNRVDFDKALAAAGLNFDKEVLVLLRHTEGSGSVQVDFRPPTVEKDKVICRIDRREPEVGTADMAYYCFALAVAKSGITEVELRVSGREAIILPVEAGGLPKKQSVQLKGGFLRWGGKGYDSARLKGSTRFAARVADKADDTAGMLVEIWVGHQGDVRGSGPTHPRFRRRHVNGDINSPLEIAQARNRALDLRLRCRGYQTPSEAGSHNRE